MEKWHTLQLAFLFSLVLIAILGPGCELEAKPKNQMIYGLSAGELYPPHNINMTKVEHSVKGDKQYCKTCHATQTSIKKDCTGGRCHNDIAEDIEQKSRFHGSACVRREFQLGGCARCHKDHRGQSLTMTKDACKLSAKNCACKGT